jgi:hypothetical protein
MTTDDLNTALHACATGIYPLEAGVALLISNGTFLHRADFTSRFITTATSISDGTTPMTAIDWDATITALPAGERRILQLAASLAAGIPVDLRDTVTGLDDHNTDLLLTAIRHAAGNGNNLPDAFRSSHDSISSTASQCPRTRASSSAEIPLYLRTRSAPLEIRRAVTSTCKLRP